MLKKYCTTCGGPTQYLSELPVFCSNCGEAFGSKSSKKKSRAKKTVPKKTNAKAKKQDDNEGHHIDDEVFSTDIGSLDFSVQSFAKPPMTIGSLAALGEQEKAPKESQKNPPKEVNREQFLEDFQREAGSLRDRGNGRD